MQLRSSSARLHLAVLLLGGGRIAVAEAAASSSNEGLSYFESGSHGAALDSSAELASELEFEQTLRSGLAEKQAQGPPQGEKARAGIAPDETIPDYLAKYDIPVEESKVITKDGYRLAVFRLPRHDAPVIMFQHGILSSAWCWIENEPRLAPAIVAWKMGYDVWMTNSRGNIYSEEHEVFHPSKSRAFWDFSFAVMGRYDVPANVEHILSATGKASLSIIGHSQGTAQIFASLSDPATRHELEGRINLFIAVSPVAYLGRSSSTLMQVMASKNDLVADTAYLVWPHGFQNRHQFLGNLLCRLSNGAVCQAGVAIACGRSKLDSIGALINISAHFPAGTSIKAVRHFAQLMKTGQFRDFDFGEESNLQIYGTPLPPAFNLSMVPDVPIALLIGSNDVIAQPDDVLRAAKEMEHTTTLVRVYEHFSHVTWLAGVEEAFQQWFPDALEMLRRYNPLPNHGEAARQAMVEAGASTTTTTL